MANRTDEPLIALVAGEASGDQLGGKLITAIRQRCPGARFCGVGGQHMRTAGMDTWWDRGELSVMGLFEVLRHLPRLMKLRRNLRTRLMAEKPDVFIGIDAPDFNLGLEKKLRESGIPTIHYVSPTVWAWRQGRVKGIGEAADLVLCLFPFEPEFYSRHGVRAEFTGHPMANAIDDQPDRREARSALGLNEHDPLIALLPGSRDSEVSRLAAPMLEAVELLSAKGGGIRWVAALADEPTADTFRNLRADAGIPETDIPQFTGRSLEVMAAADVVVCASGTAALETLLVNRPMVVVYRLAEMTYRVASGLKLIKSQFISLPNILAGEALVPELIQHEANGVAIATEIQRWMDDPIRQDHMTHKFTEIHDSLRCESADRAAAAVLTLLENNRAATTG